MTRQQFNTSDVLRLEMEADPSPGQFSNLLPNPDGRWGGYGWLTPVPSTSVDSVFSGGMYVAEAITTAAQPVYLTSEAHPVTAGQYVGAQITGRATGFAVTHFDVRVEFLDNAGAVVSTSTPSAVTAVAGTATRTNVVVPVGATQARLRVDLYGSAAKANPIANASFHFNDAIFSTAPGSTDLAALTYTALAWLDILGPTHDIAVERAELNLGTLNALIIDSSLDPSQSEALRKGKRVRLVLDGSDEPLFTGEILNAKATYDPAHPNAAKRTRIQLSAVDQAQPLANNTRPDGVASVRDLRYVLEGCGVPWMVNGFRGQIPTIPTVVARNENASAMDQVAITRDSNHAYAWFSREGVVNVWDADELAAAHGIPVATLDEDAYNADGLSIDYDTDRCINHVALKYLRIDPVTGETEEVTYGPYTDDVSRAKWGTHAAEFTVQGITEDAATLTAYAATILAANATPAVRLNEATVPINTTADVAAWALLDLYDLVTLANTNAGINEDARITRLSHRIEGGKWTVTFGFTADGGVAQPQVTPSPTPSGGKTLSQLLRPVGEVTMWYGNPNPTPTVLTNLATQPSFETSVSEWAVATGSNAPVQSSARSFVGSKSMLVERGAGTSTLWASNNLASKTSISQTYTVSARLWVPSSNPSNGGLRVSGAGVVAQADATTTLRDQWARVSVTFTRNTGTGVFFYINGGSGSTSQIWVDSVTIFQGTDPGPEFDGDTPDTETDLETIVYAWTGTPYASTSTRTATPKIGQIPAGWLLCDGSSFSATEYPVLAALLGDTHTPNMVDVFPIGAGTKALGTNGGNPTKTIDAANLPSHNHPFARSTALGSTGNFPRGGAADGTNPTSGASGVAATPMDVMNPWRALHFIIRAR